MGKNSYGIWPPAGLRPAETQNHSNFSKQVTGSAFRGEKLSSHYLFNHYTLSESLMGPKSDVSGVLEGCFGGLGD